MSSILSEAPTTLPMIEEPDPTIYSNNALYPASLIQTGEVQWQRGKRLLPIRVYPFQYNPVTGELLSSL